MANATLQGATKTNDGVTLKGILLHTVVEQCAGCAKIADFEGQEFCSAYPAPERKWAQGNCNFATHIKRETGPAAKVNPLKASKRAARGG